MQTNDELTPLIDEQLSGPHIDAKSIDHINIACGNFKLTKTIDAELAK